MRPTGIVALAVACLAFGGCNARAGMLSVDLVTDLVPGVEIFVARTTVTVPGMTPDATTPLEVRELSQDDDLRTGLRVAELGGVPSGDRRVTIELLDADGLLVVTRSVDVRVASSLSIRVVITRDCVFLACPGAGDPDDATECLAGHCVRVECADGDCVVPECETDGDCPTPRASCASNRCRDGVCLSIATPGVCDDGLTCSPDIGCVPIVVPFDPSEDVDMDGVVGAEDCDPSDPEIAVGAPEICEDGIDQNCDDADLACPPDDDGDDWDVQSDCDDANPAINPEADDICGNGVDEDCDEYDLPCAPTDLDHDQWSIPADCNDADTTVYPYAFDTCGDGIDQDCSGADVSAPCVGAYGQACGPGGSCLETRRQRLGCARANGARRRACLRCCVICANQSRFHWLNVDHSCTRAATRYCARRGRGGLETTPGIDPVQWGTCSR